MLSKLTSYTERFFIRVPHFYCVNKFGLLILRKIDSFYKVFTLPEYRPNKMAMFCSEIITETNGDDGQTCPLIVAVWSHSVHYVHAGE